jgi:hypothetical protein
MGRHDGDEPVDEPMGRLTLKESGARLVEWIEWLAGDDGKGQGQGLVAQQSAALCTPRLKAVEWWICP